MTIKCDIYKSERRVDTYLYLKADLSPDDLPEGLQALLGKLSCFLSLELNHDSKLAQVDPSDVLVSLEEQGFFLQMPPGEPLAAQSGQQIQ